MLATMAWLAAAGSWTFGASPQGLGPRPGLELGGRAAYFHQDDGAVQSRNWYGGGQARWFFSERWAAELSVDFEHIDFGRVHSDVYPVMLSALLYLAPKRRASPFLLAGAGWYFTHTTGVGGFDDESNRFGAHAGAGYEYWLTRNWSLDGTLRYVVAGDIPTSLRQIEGDGWLLTLGLNYRY